MFTIEAVLTRRPTPIEKILTRLLLSGKEVHREVMIQAIWGHRPDGGPMDADGTVAQHLSNLRRKLRNGFELISIPWTGAYLLRRIKNMAVDRYHFKARVSLSVGVEASSFEEALARLAETLEVSQIILPDGQSPTVGMFSLELGGNDDVEAPRPPPLEETPMTYIVASTYAMATNCARAHELLPARWLHVTTPEALRGIDMGHVWVYGDAPVMYRFDDIMAVASSNGLAVEHVR